MADTLAHMKVSITVTQLTFQPLFWHFKSGRWEDDQIKWSIIQPLLLASGGPVSVVGVVNSHQVKLEDRSGVRKKAIGGEMKLLHRLVTNSLDDTVIFFPDMDTNSQVWAQCHGSKTESATLPSLSWSMSDPGSGGEASSSKVRRERARPRLWVQSRVGELRTEAVTDTRHEARSRSPCSVMWRLGLLQYQPTQNILVFIKIYPCSFWLRQELRKSLCVSVCLWYFWILHAIFSGTSAVPQQYLSSTSAVPQQYLSSTSAVS